MMTLTLAILLLFPSVSLAVMTDSRIAALQRELADKPPGDRIVFWAETFLDTPYDPDPLGEYVTRKAIVTDERIDCMYLVFRAVELGLGKNPSDTMRIALDKRFTGRGKFAQGKVLNYEDRFQYGEDMIDSGKWGKEITSSFGKTVTAAGSRGRKSVVMVAPREFAGHMDRLLNGDIVFFIKSPEKRVSGEIVGHMGIVKKEAGKVYLIHASGVKNKGGRVKKVLFSDYLASMPFIGIRVSRFSSERHGADTP
jgi:hypothetical protein